MQNDESQGTSTGRNDTIQPQEGSTEENHIVTSVSTTASRIYHWPPIPTKTLLVGLAFIVVVTALIYGTYWYNTNLRHTTAHTASQVISRFEHALSHGSTATVNGTTLPPYQPAGYSFPAKPDTASAIIYTVSSDQLTKTYQKVQHILTLENMSGKTAPGARAGATPYKYYDNAYVHCSLTTAQPSADWTVQVACASSSAYTAAAAQMKQFHDLYVANNPATPNIIVSKLSIQSSRSKGYKTADAIILYNNGIDGFPVSYYQTPDSAWHYFRTSLVTPLCKDFSTPDLRKAYLGQTCYSNTADRLTTVAL